MRSTAPISTAGDVLGRPPNAKLEVPCYITGRMDRWETAVFCIIGGHEVSNFQDVL